MSNMQSEIARETHSTETELVEFSRHSTSTLSLYNGHFEDDIMPELRIAATTNQATEPTEINKLARQTCQLLKEIKKELQRSKRELTGYSRRLLDKHGAPPSFWRRLKWLLSNSRELKDVKRTLTETRQVWRRIARDDLAKSSEVAKLLLHKMQKLWEDDRDAARSGQHCKLVGAEN